MPNASHERPSYLETWRDLSRDKRMVFVAGPRQAGKTTFAHLVARTFRNSLYFNWDIPKDRTRLLADPAFFTDVERRDDSTPLIVLDEIHQYRDWKNYLKGVADGYGDEYRFLVSGSGRLDLYQRGGDSLAGRYLPFHLWPFTLSELTGGGEDFEAFWSAPLAMGSAEPATQETIWSGLETRSGFPEPYLSGRATSWRRWSNTYSRQLIREDIRDLADVRRVGEMETLFHLLPHRVGSPLSVPSLARDLKVAYNTVRGWLDLFERFFLSFRLAPWTRSISRAIQKERKIYLWDTPRIPNQAARFENQVALELWRAVTSWTDRGLGDFTLHFVRNKEQQEVDFLVAEGHQPRLLVEAKLTDTTPSSSLCKFQAALGIPALQLTRGGETYQRRNNAGLPLVVAPAPLWLCRLP